MHFAKTHAGVRINLAGSGIADTGLSDLGIDPRMLDDLQGPNTYGWPPLLDRIAGRFGVRPDCVAQAAGASFANHLALAALVEPGDRVLVETPGYELIVSTLLYLGAEIVRVERRAEDGFRIDLRRMATLMGPRTSLVVVTNLHNPTSVRTSAEDMAGLAALVRDAGARLIIDEVYLELTLEEAAPETAFHLNAGDEDHVVVTSSLTKAYGLSGLRCGWVLAAPALAERMRRLNDLFSARGAFLLDQLGLAAIDLLPGLRARARDLLGANLRAYREILGDHPALDQTIPEIGTTVFPRLIAGDGDGFSRRLETAFETGVAPGRFFDAPDHIRIGMAADPGLTREGFERIARCLDTGW